MFSVLMDETTDVSHKEQLLIFVQFVTEDGNIEEWLFALTDAAVPTGKVLTSILMECLNKHKLDI